ncbi:MAG: TraB/GumN family protein, partial [Pseudomonadota bacterium]
TAEEQFQALLGDDDADGDRLLRAMLPMAESTAESLHTYRALYRTRHVGAVWSLSVASVEDALGAEEARLLLDRIWDALLRKRNAKMLTTMLPALRQGGVFAAVGALHLVGEDGLISLLEEADFTLAPVPGG